MITKEQFIEEITAIIEAQQKKQIIEDGLNGYIKGVFHCVPDANEERAVRYLSGLIGLGIDSDSPLMEWYYSPFRDGDENTDFCVEVDGEKQILVTPEDFYDFYCGDQNDKI